MRRFRDLPIQLKLERIVLLTTVAALGLVGTIVVSYQIHSYPREATRKLSALAEILAANTSAALTFRDVSAARETLGALKRRPDICWARLYTTDAQLFTEVSPQTPPPVISSGTEISAGAQFAHGMLMLWQPVQAGNETIGWLQICSDMRFEYRHLQIAVLIALSSLGLAALAVVLVMRKVSGLVVDPILELSRVATAVGRRHDYSVRATKQTNDEVGELTSTFNEMLDQIQQRDREVSAAYDELAKTAGQLQVTEERFRQLAENVAEVFWMTTPDKTQMLYISPAYETIWGRTCESLYREPFTWLDAIHPEDRERVRGALPQQSAGGYDIEYRIVRGDGTQRWIRDRAFPISDVSGKVYRIAGIAEDITVRKQAETELRNVNEMLEQRVRERTAELQESESRLRLALDASKAGTWSWEVTSSTSHWDEQYRTMYGFGPDDPISYAAWLGRIHPEDRQHLEERIQALLEPGSDDVWNEDFRVVHPTKGTRWMTGLGRVERDASGQAVRFAGINLDTTERKEIEERLRLSLHASQAGVWSWDAATDSVRWDEQYRLLYGFDRHEPVSHESWLTKLHPDDRARIVAKIEALRDLHGPDVWNEEFRIAHPVKGVRWLGELGRIEHDAAGRLVSSAGISFDITERKQIEESLRRSKEFGDALNRINEALHSTLDFREVIQRLVAEGATALHSETAAISLRQDNGWIVNHVLGMPPGLLGTHMSDDNERHAVLAIQSNEPVAVADAFQDERFNREHLRRHNVRAVLVTPLIIRDQPFGVIFFNYHSAPHPFSESEVNFARQLAATAAIALDNARLFDEHKRTEEKIRRINAQLDLRVQERTAQLETVNAALRLQQQEQQIILDSVPSFIWYKDCHNRVIRINQSAAAAIGKTVAEAEGKPTEELYPDAAAQYYRDDLEVIRSGQPKLGIVETVTVASGEKRWVQTDKVPFRNERGEIIGIVVCATDVSELRQTRETLAESEERFRLAFDRAPVGVSMVDERLRFIRSNDAYCEMLGYTREELLNLTVADITIPEDRDATKKIIQRELTGEIPGFKMEKRYRTKQGGTIWVNVTATAVRDAAGKALYSLGIVENITARRQAEQALFEAENKFRLLVERVPAVTYTSELGAEGRWHYISPQIETLLGFTPAEWMKDPGLWWRQVHPADRSVALPSEKQCREQKAFHVEYRMHARDNRVVWVRDDGVLVESADHPPLVQGVMQDITFRKQAQEALEQSEERYRTLVDSARDIIATVTPDGRILSLNPASEAVLGWPRAEWFGRQFTSLVHPDDLPVVMTALEQVARGESPAPLDMRLRCQNGTWAFTETVAQPLRKEGKVVGVLGLVRDVTARRQAEEVAREAQQRLQNIYDSSQDAIALGDLTGRLLELNHAYERLTGYSKAELLAMTYYQLTPPEFRELKQRIAAELIRGGPPVRYDNEFLRKDGSRVPVSITSFLVRNAAGQPTGIAAIIRDMTEQRRLEGQILEVSDREQRRIGQDLHDSLCQMLIGTSFAAKALEDRLAAAKIPAAQDVHAIIALIEHAVGETRTLARGLHPVNLEVGGLGSALRELAESVQSLYNLPCTVQVEPELTIQDETRAIHAYRIVQEAVNNALKHAGAKQINIGLSQDDNLVALSVTDNGVGLPDHLEQRRGMGFSIMAYRARMLGGTLSIERGKTGGTVVNLVFPAM